MSDDKDDLSADPEVRKARIAKYLAEAAMAQASADEKKERAIQARMETEEIEKDRTEKRASNFENRVYDFVGEVTGGTAENAMSTLSKWTRLNGNPITLRLSSPGGSVIAGLGLYDFIVDYVRGKKRIHVTTVGLGYAASMGAILLQAGDTRVMGSQCQMLIHEIASGTIGKLSEMEDEVKFANKLNERLVLIIAERAKKAPNATKPMSLAQIKTHSKRKDWWVNAEDALKWGFIDEVGY